MNVIRLMGGLGNQLFQYAFGKAMMQHGTDVRFNSKWYTSVKNAHRPYRLDKFYTDVPVGSFNHGIIYEKGVNKGKCDINLLKKDGYAFAGYWQYLTYFKSVIPILQKEIRVREEFYNEEFLSLREIIANTNSVGVHVRRGDYVIQRGFHDLPFDYYLRALGNVKGDLFIFSDDIPWCREKFKESYFSCKIRFVSTVDYLDFELLKSCRHQVTTNSTFSYWAALLNDNPDKIVVSPNRWLGDNIINDENRFPKEWIKIFDYVI